MYKRFYMLCCPPALGSWLYCPSIKTGRTAFLMHFLNNPTLPCDSEHPPFSGLKLVASINPTQRSKMSVFIFNLKQKHLKISSNFSEKAIYKFFILCNRLLRRHSGLYLHQITNNQSYNNFKHFPSVLPLNIFPKFLCVES